MRLFDDNSKLLRYCYDILMFAFLSYIFDSTYTIRMFLMDCIFFYLKDNLLFLFPEPNYIKNIFIFFSLMYFIDRHVCLLNIINPIIIEQIANKMKNFYKILSNEVIRK